MINNQFPRAIYVHCACHSLNLVISDSCSNVFIRNCIDSIREIYSYFKSSSKRTLQLNEVIDNSTKKKLVKVCDTRWVERHECVITFRDLYPFVVDCLRSIIEKENGKDRTIAFSQLKNIQSSQFIVALCVLKKCLSITLPVAVGLQAPGIDLMECKSIVDDILLIFRSIRGDKLDSTYNEVLEDVKELCDFLGKPAIIDQTLN